MYRRKPLLSLLDVQIIQSLGFDYFVTINLKTSHKVAKIVGIAIVIATWMLAGHLAAKLVRGQDYGFVGNTALGFVGGVVGSLVLGLFGLGHMGNLWLIGGLVAGVVGAVILLYAMQFFSDQDGCCKSEPDADMDVKVKRA